MNELKSYTEYAVSTPTSDFVIGFDFNYGEDAVNVTVDNVPAQEAGYTVVYLDESTIQLSPSVPSGVVRLQRETDIDQSDNAYRAGAKFIAQTMDENFEQLRHSQQEVRDGFQKLSDDTYTIIDTLEEVAQSAQDAADDANAAAQVANDAAAQVADKVSQSELVDALDPLYGGVSYVGRYTPLPYENAKNYEVGQRVTLSTGEVVENLVPNNNVNPNTDMLGWVKVNSASRVFDENGKTQQEINTVLNGVGSTPRGLGQPDSTTPAVNNNVYIGGYGSYSAANETKARATWDATNLSDQPTVGRNSLGLSGNFISSTANSSIILGGRPSYYSRVIDKGALTLTYGADNSNGHLAGVVLGYHCDLFSDPAGTGSHGCIVGGSYKQSNGDYSGSFAGTVHQVYGLSSVALGGSQIKIGTLSDATLTRRCATLGGYMINLVSGQESAIVGGNTCSITSSNRSGIYTSEQSTITSANNSAIVGGFNNAISANATRSSIVGGARNTVSAQHAQVLNGTDNIASAPYSTAIGFNALADTYGSVARSSGMFSVRGDSQVYDLTLRRSGSGTSVFLSLDGGGSLDAYTVKVNQVGVFNLNITGIDTNTKQTWCFNLLASFSTASGSLAIKGNKLTVAHEDVAGVGVAIVSAASGTRVGVSITLPTAIDSRWNASGTLTVQNI